MDPKYDNKNCPPKSQPVKLFLCSGCSSANYCSKECQNASWSSHKQDCNLNPPPSLSGIRLHIAEPRSDDEDLNHGENESSGHKIVNVNIEHTEADKTVEVGSVKIQVIDLSIVRRFGFFDCLDEYSHELGKLALHFDDYGLLRPNSGCWRPADFYDEDYLIYLQELILEPAWRGKGLGTWLLPNLFHLKQLNGANFIFTWPTVLSHLEPPSINGLFGVPTPAEQAAWLTKRDRIIKFYQKAR
ncbi:hypothetical protein B0H17DRAFT_1188216 [Mycena rosella]|uniref:MYND-type domain-containing protein n=1 Tax=Mycena rosella TaxID=1033263 RepID=A0AAD7BL53_MYCRO|nr:hypothetical protein B0H17DRAFT_1188216 [Mycena rosella]